MLLGWFLTISLLAQAPQKMSYQAVIRNSSNVLITNTTVGVKISILQGSETGTSVYTERQTPTTNANGLASFEIGNGTVLSGTFAAINWAVGPYFIKTEADPTGGTAYTITGTSQFNSVPYALYSANGSAGVGGFSHYIGEPYLGGIVYYLYKGSDGLEHGLVVSLTESTILQWQTVVSWVNGNRTWDGAYNTALMINSPAKNYITTLGSDWYIPSIDELVKLNLHYLEINKVLATGGHTLISHKVYWSSTEGFGNMDGVYVFLFRDCLSSVNSKTSYLNTRGVRAF